MRKNKATSLRIQKPQPKKMMSELPENSESPQKAVAQPPLVRLSRQEQLSLKIGDTLWFSDYGDMKHCYEYQIKKLTNGRAVSGISLRDAKRKDVHVFRANRGNHLLRIITTDLPITTTTTNRKKQNETK